MTRIHFSWSMTHVKCNEEEKLKTKADMLKRNDPVKSRGVRPDGGKESTVGRTCVTGRF